ncbi:LysM peptidoglycan-binding domain-containing protein [Qingshengfaniella alkalisoli]|nr:LysM peptidoglycan-binding domain-containing protein [Qingshengfaniella alkalisoli]
MDKTVPTRSSRVVLAGSVAAVAIATVVGIALYDRRTDEIAVPVEEPAAEPLKETAVPVDPEPEAVDEPARPAIDVVRVDPDGRTVVAGRAAPGQTIRIILDGETLTEVTAGAGGEFVAFTDVEDTGEPRSVWVTGLDTDGELVTSDANVIVAPRKESVAERAVTPSAAAEARVEQADNSPVPESAVQTAEVVADPSSPSTDDTTPKNAEPPVRADVSTPGDSIPAGPDAQGRAPQLLVSDSGGVRLMAPPEVSDADGMQIDTIAYGEGDTVELRGRSSQPGEVRLTLDGEEIARVSTKQDGSWEADVEGIDAGTYTLSAERVDAAPNQPAKVSVPFKRESPATIAAVAQAEPAKIVTVQPGFTLWGIARDRYGEGLQYVQVFEANRDQINNPDLIYPGQIFDLPGIDQ